jgi:hypothetical protein
MGRKMGLAPHNATGHAPSCDRLRPFPMPAYFYQDDNTCAHCGYVLLWERSDPHATGKQRLGWRYWPTVYFWSGWNMLVAGWRRLREDTW